MHKSKKNALLEAAKELFGEYGYVETTFKKISEKAGVALGLLTHHYGNKEKLFLAAGLDVLEQFLNVLREATSKGNTGYESVMNFCKAYLEFSIDKNSNWLVLVRCSPYSDMKTSADRELMTSSFQQVSQELEACLKAGVLDGSIRSDIHTQDTAQVIIALMVGVNRTHLLTPYAGEHLYDEALQFVSRALKP